MIYAFADDTDYCSPGSTCTITTTLEKRLLIILIIVIAIAIGLCLALAANSKGRTKKILINETSNVCLSPECISTAAHLLHSMDLNQEPCDDFYSFVCKNWIKDTYLVGEITTQFTRLDSNIHLRIKVHIMLKVNKFSVIQSMHNKKWSMCGKRERHGAFE
ncbi:hypothetical protein CDAR_116511 [Caerostris darwini]|uniref:Peptidase M13 N-terminal domain-containing protein n=1 Tax=Caerostris darwini TaxID=1538125 RepID=A0AAV4X5S3_9ARAC|nr:hypothetical protein CDAR_116511 [Caerostris darwini]